MAELESSTQDQEFRANLSLRHRRGSTWHLVFQVSTIVGIIALTALLYNVVRNAFGLAAVQNSIDPQNLVLAVQTEQPDLFDQANPNPELGELPQETLVAIFEAKVSKGLYRRYDSEQPFAERTQENVYELILERVVEPRVVKTWNLVDSLLRRDEIMAEAAQEYPGAEVRFVSWLKPGFVTSPQSSIPEKAGVRTAIFGSLWTIAITIGFSFPMGVGAAIYLEDPEEIVTHCVKGVESEDVIVVMSSGHFSGLPRRIFDALKNSPGTF